MFEGNAEMQINKAENTQGQTLLDAGAKARGARPAAQADALTVEPRNQAYIDKALALTDDAAAVAEAKQLLASGALDTPEAIRQAAQNMLDQGI
jgi:hypothetical protein